MGLYQGQHAVQGDKKLHPSTTKTEINFLKTSAQ
jgi:hypothetical protein